MPKHALLVRSKVKTGCQTCKLRKVKCDEGKPVCRRCQSSGRVCSGYGVWGGGADTSGLQPYPTGERALALPSPAKRVRLMSFSASEQFCFEWYTCRSAKKLPGAFIADSWTSLLFQASTTEPAIRHAVLALGSAHIDEVQRATTPESESNDEQPLITVRQYSKAITNLQPHFTKRGKTSIRVAVTSCALFIDMEFLLGNYAQGLVHLKHGLGLLRELGINLEDQDSSSIYIDGWLVTIFTRLLVQARLLGQVLDFPCRSLLGPVFPPKLDTFTTIHQARRTLEHLLLRTFDLQERAHQQTATVRFELGHDMLECQNSIKVELQTWIRMHAATVINLPSTRALMDMFTSHQPVPQILMDAFAYSLLRLYHCVATILASTCLEYPDETVFDRHESDFLSILSQSMEISWIRSLGGELTFTHHYGPNSPNSTADMGWIPPLYFTAVKCRNHRIRHQAVKLLQGSLHKEGIWNAVLAISVARQVIQIEEQHFYEHVGGDDFGKREAPTKQDLATATLPEAFRLSNVSIVLPNNPAGKLLLRCGRKATLGVMDWISKEFDIASGKWTEIPETKRCRP